MLAIQGGSEEDLEKHRESKEVKNAQKLELAVPQSAAKIQSSGISFVRVDSVDPPKSSKWDLISPAVKREKLKEWLELETLDAKDELAKMTGPPLFQKNPLAWEPNEAGRAWKKKENEIRAGLFLVEPRNSAEEWTEQY